VPRARHGHGLASRSGDPWTSWHLRGGNIPNFTTGGRKHYRWYKQFTKLWFIIVLPTLYIYVYVYVSIYICKYIYNYINLIRYSNRLPRPFRDRTISVCFRLRPSARFRLEVFDAAQLGMMSCQICQLSHKFHC
jgi:hypothetical protein